MGLQKVQRVDLKYSKEHEWAKEIGGNRGRVGITHYAQDQLGDVVFVDLPAIGSQVKQFQQFGTIESVKAVSDLYAPVNGEVVEVNGTLADAPETVNSDPYGEGWMIKVKLAGDAGDLMSAADYAKIAVA